MAGGCGGPTGCTGCGFVAVALKNETTLISDRGMLEMFWSETACL